MTTLAVAMAVRLGLALGGLSLLGYVCWRTLRRPNNGFGCLNQLKAGRSHQFPY